MQFTLLFEGYVIALLRIASINEVGQLLGLGWNQVARIQDRSIQRGLKRRKHELPIRIGIDEKAFRKRHRYVTSVVDLDRSKVIFVAEGRKEEALNGFFSSLSPEQIASIQTIAVDMWEPYLAGIRKWIPEWEKKVVYDRFHIMQMATKAVDRVRKQEHRELMTMGDDSLKKTKHIWLKNEENHSHAQKKQFKRLKASDLRTARAWAIKKSLQRVWVYRSHRAADQYFKRWFFWATHSQLPPMRKLAVSLKKKIKNITTYAIHQVTNSQSESMNSKIQWIRYQSRGFGNLERFKQSIMFHCGGLDLSPL